MKSQPDPALITVPAGARRIGVTAATAVKLARAGTLPKIFWLGGRRYWLTHDLDVCLKRLAATKDTPHAA